MRAARLLGLVSDMNSSFAFENSAIDATAAAGPLRRRKAAFGVVPTDDS